MTCVTSTEERLHLSIPEIEERLLDFIIHNIPHHFDFLIDRDASFFGSLRLDSLGVVELMCGIEDAFQVELQDDMGERIRTVGDAATAIAEAIQQQPQPHYSFQARFN